jgi:hypothetical protein
MVVRTKLHVKIRLSEGMTPPRQARQGSPDYRRLYTTPTPKETIVTIQKKKKLTMVGALCKGVTLECGQTTSNILQMDTTASLPSQVVTVLVSASVCGSAGPL